MSRFYKKKIEHDTWKHLLVNTIFPGIYLIAEYFGYEIDFPTHISFYPFSVLLPGMISSYFINIKNTVERKIKISANGILGKKGNLIISKESIFLITYSKDQNNIFPRDLFTITLQNGDIYCYSTSSKDSEVIITGFKDYSYKFDIKLANELKNVYRVKREMKEWMFPGPAYKYLIYGSLYIFLLILLYAAAKN